MENSIIEPDKGGYPFKIKYVIQVMFGIFIFILAKFLLKEDFFPFFKWWFVLLLLGIIFLPMTQKLFRFFHDNGYLFSKTVGLALTGYLMWFLSSLRIMKFNSLSCVIAGLLFLCINAFLFIKTKEEAKIPWLHRIKLQQ
ncbi:hypothetical protein Ana3638_18380 [Anaerocolumna sedimenticola]|uniref:Uncharacterized protein n=1 Tax=Anaerocolumna sedimenticola TaxID=2696063 RepID=A0A6P1TQ86_9FIRM|nr:hypothetical protein [Anaerocolumna sedimenticola]QHQ62507.1 hypothetical protein Ana3638_18380 [Anaerocolumna sedimenticola]